MLVVNRISQRQLCKITTIDSRERFVEVIRTLLLTIMEFFSTHCSNEGKEYLLLALKTWKEQSTALAFHIHQTTRRLYSADPASVLGASSKLTHNFVRGRLGVPFLHTEESFAQVQGRTKAGDDAPTNFEKMALNVADAAWPGIASHQNILNNAVPIKPTSKPFIPTSIDKPIIKASITNIFTSLRTGVLYVPVMECLKEVWVDRHGKVGIESDGPLKR